MNEVIGEMPELITPRPFFKAGISPIMHLHCGDSDHGHEATYWIHGQHPPSVRTELNRGGRVWLYYNQLEEEVGFGSLSITTWNIGQEDVDIQYIPMLGVFHDFQGKPPSDSGLPKYCYQIIDHLIDEAELKSETYPLLGLAVRPDNDEAIYIYEKSGFQWVKDTEGYSRMFLSLI
jgi:ribosomal protein S18 acetylase RimI-like enzyme